MLQPLKTFFWCRRRDEAMEVKSKWEKKQWKWNASERWSNETEMQVREEGHEHEIEMRMRLFVSKMTECHLVRKYLNWLYLTSLFLVFFIYLSHFLNSNFLLFHFLLSISLQGYRFSTCFEIQNVSEHNQMIWGYNPCLFHNTQTVSPNMKMKTENEWVTSQKSWEKGKQREREKKEWKEFVFSKCKLRNGNDACEQSCIPLSVTLHLKWSGKIERKRGKKKERHFESELPPLHNLNWHLILLNESVMERRRKENEMEGIERRRKFRVLFWKVRIFKLKSITFTLFIWHPQEVKSKVF